MPRSFIEQSYQLGVFYTGYVFVFDGAWTAKGVPDMARRIDGRAPEFRVLAFYVVIASSFAFALGIDKLKVVSLFEVS